MRFEELDEFRKDLKRLQKRYRSLPEDLDIIRKILKVHPFEKPPFSFRIIGLGIETLIIKVKKIACKSLKGKGAQSGLRLIYAHLPENLISRKSAQIIFIELYHKSDKQLEDRDRIYSNFKSI